MIVCYYTFNMPSMTGFSIVPPIFKNKTMKNPQHDVKAN